MPGGDQQNINDWLGDLLQSNPPSTYLPPAGNEKDEEEYYDGQVENVEDCHNFEQYVNDPFKLDYRLVGKVCEWCKANGHSQVAKFIETFPTKPQNFEQELAKHKNYLDSLAKETKETAQSNEREKRDMMEANNSAIRDLKIEEKRLEEQLRKQRELIHRAEEKFEDEKSRMSQNHSNKMAKLHNKQSNTDGIINYILKSSRSFLSSFLQNPEQFGASDTFLALQMLRINVDRVTFLETSTDGQTLKNLQDSEVDQFYKTSIPTVGARYQLKALIKNMNSTKILSDIVIPSTEVAPPSDIRYYNANHVAQLLRKNGSNQELVNAFLKHAITGVALPDIDSTRINEIMPSIDIKNAKLVAEKIHEIVDELM